MEHWIVVGKTVSRYWQRSARRHQLKIVTAACALVVTTGKGQMLSIALFLNCASGNVNTIMGDNLNARRNTPNAASRQKPDNASNDCRGKQRGSSNKRGERCRTSIRNSRCPVDRPETKRPGGTTGVDICTAAQVQPKKATQFAEGKNAGGQALGAHFATRGL